jgi:hypothetical protein
MARLLEFSPYLLAAATIALAVFELIKDWDDYRNSWLKISALGAMCLIAVLTFVSLHQDNQDKRAQREDAKKLEGEVEAANKAQTNNTVLFLSQFKDLSQQVSTLQTEVKTDTLQKKLATVQAELQSTEKALAPGPKAQLSFSFDPPSYSPDGKQSFPSTEITLPVSAADTISVPFDIMNTTEVDALDGEVTLVICKGCKFVKDPDEFRQLSGQPDGARNMPFARILPKSMVNKTVDVIVPKGYADVILGITYRCKTCDVPKDVSQGTVRLARLGRDFPK